MKKEIVAKKGAQAIGPYSQGIIFGNLIFVSGQIGKDPNSNELAKGIKEQTLRIFSSIKEILKSADSDLENVLKVTVYLKNMDDYPVMNDVYASFFKKPYPARATVQVAKLPKDALIEIECIAFIKNVDESCGGDCNCC